jgi:hypothetical protein
MWALATGDSATAAVINAALTANDFTSRPFRSWAEYKPIFSR